MSYFAEQEARIRQLYANYADAVWRKDAAAVGQCYTPDAEWRIAGMVMKGRDAIASGFERIMTTANRVLLTVGTPQIELAGPDGACGRVYMMEQCTWSDKGPNTNIGRYYERFALVGGNWCFSWRLFQLLYKGADDFSGDFYKHPDFGPWPGMPSRDAIPAALPAREWAA